MTINTNTTLYKRNKFARRFAYLPLLSGNTRHIGFLVLRVFKA
jgi:hypothetical protein